MAAGLVDPWEEGKVDHKCTIIVWSNESMFTEGHWEILTVELGIEFLIKIDTMCGHFKSINSSCFVDVMESIIIEEFTGCGVKMNSILSVFMGKETESMPVGCLPNT